jgi:hypothetical protein
MTTQLTGEDVAQLRRERKDKEINQARLDGRLDILLGVPRDTVALHEKARSIQQLTEDDVSKLFKNKDYELIVAANEAGRITYTPKGN